MKFDNLIAIAYSILPEVDNDCASKHFSFALRGNKILAMGINKPRTTHPLSLKFNHRFSTIHSELSLIQKCRFTYDLSDLTLVNIRLSTQSLWNNRPILRNSKPCSNCLHLLETFRFRKIYYTTEQGFEKL